MEISVAMETATRDAQVLSNPNVGTQDVHKLSGRASKYEQERCKHCGCKNHASDDCRWKNAICRRSEKTGHLQRICKGTAANNPSAKGVHSHNSRRKVKSLEVEEPDEVLEMFSLKDY